MAYQVVLGPRTPANVRAAWAAQQRIRAGMGRVRGGWRMGLGMSTAGGADLSSDPSYGDTVTPVSIIQTPTTLNLTTPVAPSPVSTLLSPSSPTDVGTVSPNQVIGVATLGSQLGCPAGQVIVDDINGTCGTAAALASTLASAAGASSLGLTAAQAAALAAQLASGGSVAQPASTVSTNPFASISSTTWLIGGAVVFGVLLISMGKKR